MKKLWAFVAVISAACLFSLNAADVKKQQDILNKINSLPMPFTAGTVAQSEYTVQKPYLWQFKVKNDVYHAAIIFEDYPDGIYSSSQRFLSLFMVWKNGRVYYRRVIENDPEHIKITNCKIEPSSDGGICLVLNYNFTPYFEDSFTRFDGKYSIVLPVTGHLNASIKDFESLSIGDLTIKNGVARAKILPQPSPKLGYCIETDNYRRKNPVYQIVFPHCYVVKNANHIFHIALVDRQHEDLLSVYIWKDRKLHAVYLLDHYEQFYSTPDRMKISSAPGATRSVKTPDGKHSSIPVWEGIALRYAVNNYFGRADSEKAPSTRYYKYNYLTVKLKNHGIYDMRKQRFDWGFTYSPQLKEKHYL